MAVPQSTVDQIVALTQAGLSRRMVADQLGVTRGTVCGLVHRLGITPTVEAPRIRKPPGGGRRQPQTRAPAPARAAGIVGVIRPPATLLDLADDGCHWPIRWGSGRILFCNCGRGGSGHPSYCRRHALRSTRPDPRRSACREIAAEGAETAQRDNRGPWL
jgi:hypothetical protein